MSRKFTPREEAFCHALIDTLREYAREDISIVQLIPQYLIGGRVTCGLPIIIPPGLHNSDRAEAKSEDEEDEDPGSEVDYSCADRQPVDSDTQITMQASKPARSSTPVDNAIIAVLREAKEPLKIYAIAKRANVKYNSYFRSRVSYLCDLPPREDYRLVRCAEDTYWLVCRGAVPFCP